MCLCGKMFEVCWVQGVKHKKKKKLGGVPLAKKKKKNRHRIYYCIPIKKALVAAGGEGTQSLPPLVTYSRD